MPTPEPKPDLTGRAIGALAPRPTQYVVWDGDVRGFGVRVSPAGAKLYILKYRLKSGRVRWKSYGRTDGALSLDEARAAARRDRGLVADGKDPLAQIDRAREAVTVSTAAERFLTEHGRTRKPSTQRMYALAIDHMRRVIGSVPIADVTDEDASRVHQRLRGTPIQANRTLAVLSSLLAWAMDGKVKLREKGPNPCHGIERFPERRRRRYLSTAEYARLGRVLRAVAKEETIAPAPRTAIELLLLTGARPAEIASLQWAHVDLTRGALDLPESKTGAKTIHLPPEAVRILKRWPRWATSPYVFPGNGRRDKGEHMHPSTLAHSWETIRELAKLEDCRLYDACRHSFASMAVSQGLTLAQIGEQLGHSQPATTKRYAHLHDDAARQNATTIGGSIATAMKRRAR